MAFLLVLPLLLLGFNGCSTMTSQYHEDFSEYYNVGTFKGLELYAWQDDGSWYSGLIFGTNRLKTVEEIERLQDNPCPIKAMKDILSTYTLEERRYCVILIVSTPPLETELQRSAEDVDERIDDYAFLSNYLGVMN